METARILIIEDEASLAIPVKRGLDEDGHTVDWVDNGQDGLIKALSEPYDLIVLDWRLPRLNGLAVIKSLRSAGIQSRILMLTAMRNVEYRVAGLNAGADDYLTKPFSFDEFLARIHALIRRTDVPHLPEEAYPVSLRMGPLELHSIRRTVRCGGQPLHLRGKEFQLLELLMQRPGDVISRTHIAEHVWGSPFDVTDNAIDVTVSKLRRRLQDETARSAHTITLETLRGVGYRLVARPRSQDPLPLQMD
jgi:DNA-binding response OmpR family regulator